MTKKPLKIAVFCQPIESLSTKKDTTLALMDAATRLTHLLFYGNITDLFANHSGVFADLAKIQVELHKDQLKINQENKKIMALKEFDIIFMRQDPPVDASYWHVTQLLSLVENANTVIVNPPSALRTFNEKLAILLFPELTPPLLVSYSLEKITAFANEHQDVVCKPLITAFAA